MSANDWRRLKFASYTTTALNSALIWMWGLLGIDPGRWLAQSNALILIAAVVLAQIADVLGDRARHREWAEEIQRLHSHAIGNVDCRFNARSPVVRCAVNPAGPCEGCQHYQLRGAKE